MIAWICFWAVVAILVAEGLSLMVTPGRLRVKCDCDMKLVEPGETVTIEYEVTNTGSLPFSFVGLSLSFDEQVEVRESEEWKAAHLDKSWRGVNIGHKFLLMPHRKFMGRVHVAFDKRGMHKADRVYVEAGDLLGFRSAVDSRDPEIGIICTAHMYEDMESPKTLGGILGDISVRRFIYEDPNLLIGYHDYTGHEPMKQISWTRTAMTGHMMVKQQDYTVDADVTVLVDMTNRDKALMEDLLKLTRTVCEKLEDQNIPYNLISNGDLREFAEGLGKGHLYAILQRIGVSRGACYISFEEAADKALRARRSNRSFIVLAADKSDQTMRVIDRLQAASDHKLEVLIVGDK